MLSFGVWATLSERMSIPGSGARFWRACKKACFVDLHVLFPSILHSADQEPDSSDEELAVEVPCRSGLLGPKSQGDPSPEKEKGVFASGSYFGVSFFCVSWRYPFVCLSFGILSCPTDKISRGLRRSPAA